MNKRNGLGLLLSLLGTVGMVGAVGAGCVGPESGSDDELEMDESAEGDEASEEGGDQAGEEVGAAEAALVVDTTCNGNSLWVYDTVDRTGNRICFNQPGTVELKNYCRTWTWGYNKWTGQYQEFCSSSWAGKVRSYWPGNETGSFSVPQTGVDNGQLGCREWFGTMYEQGFTIGGSCVQQATRLAIDWPVS